MKPEETSKPALRGLWPSIDHSLLSPSGKMSKRARKAALEREGKRIFGPGGFLQPEPTPQPSEPERLRRHAKTLRDLAARGMSVRKFTKEADKAEAEAVRLEADLTEKRRRLPRV